MPDIPLSNAQPTKSTPDAPKGDNMKARVLSFDETPATTADQVLRPFSSSTVPPDAPVYDVTPIAMRSPVSKGDDALLTEAGFDDAKEGGVEARREVSSDEKKQNMKRAASPLDNVPKMKKIKVSGIDDFQYKQFVENRYHLKKSKQGEPLPPFIRIGGFETSYIRFSEGLRQRARLNNDVMSLYIESFNIDSSYSTKKPKKFAFSCNMSARLCVDPSTFQTKSCIKEFKKACENFDKLKPDLLFFVIVNDGHWAVVVANLSQKQFNVFDSVRLENEFVGYLEGAYRNLITNLKKVAKEAKTLKHDLEAFESIDFKDYPRQKTTFDCGFFAILYLENFTGKAMKAFVTDTKSMLNFRKFITCKLIKHRCNTLDTEEELKKLLESS